MLIMANERKFEIYEHTEKGSDPKKGSIVTYTVGYNDGYGNMAAGSRQDSLEGEIADALIDIALNIPKTSKPNQLPIKVNAHCYLGKGSRVLLELYAKAEKVPIEFIERIADKNKV